MAKRRHRRMPRRPDSTPQEGEIRDVTAEGFGVTTNEEGKAVFVLGALPGETVRFKQMKSGKTHNEAIVEEVLVASPDRVEPRCPHFGVCGGCTFQHLHEDKQIEQKQSMMLDNLQRIGEVTPAEVLPPLRAESSWGYRRKARLAVRAVKGKGRVLVGFREKYAPFVMDMTSCDILHPEVAKLLPVLSEVIGRLTIADKVPQIEVAMGDDVVAMVFRVLEEPTTDDVRELQEFAKAHTVDAYLQPKGLDSTYPIVETRQLTYALPEFDAEVLFQPHDFTQVNTELNQLMVSRAVQLLDLQADDVVLELFSGLGNFTLPIARHAKKVWTVEGDASLVKRAEENARYHGLTNIETFVANLYDESEFDPKWASVDFDKVLLDPPRSGAQGEVLKLIGESKATTVVYVSCHPGTLARDLAELTKHGFSLDKAGVMDMFPHTAHVESIALLTRTL